MQRVVSKGRFVHFPEIRFTYDGRAMVSFIMEYTDTLGIDNEIQCELYQPMVDYDKNLDAWSDISRLDEGDEVAVSGVLQTKMYTTLHGKRKAYTYLVCDSMAFYKNGTPVMISGVQPE